MMQTMPFKSYSEAFHKLDAIADTRRLTPQEQSLYDRSLKALRDRAAADEYIRLTATEEGLRQGLQQGLQQGLHQGLQQGFQNGRDMIVRNMKQMGLDIKTIAEASGLTVEAVQAIE